MTFYNHFFIRHFIILDFFIMDFFITLSQRRSLTSHNKNNPVFMNGVHKWGPLPNTYVAHNLIQKGPR